MSVDLDAYLPPDCGVEGCDLLGPFATDDGPRCFEHSGLGESIDIQPVLDDKAAELDEVAARRKRRKAEAEPAEDMNDTAARALAALVLQATADALSADTAKMEAAITGLAADLPAPLEVAAAVLFATTAIAGTAQLTDQEVFVIGAAFEDQAVEESQEATDGTTEAQPDEPIERGDDEQDGS